MEALHPWEQLLDILQENGHKQRQRTNELTGKRPLAILLGSRLGEMERKPNGMAKWSDDFSEEGCKPVWTGDAI